MPLSFAVFHLFLTLINPFEIPFQDKKELTNEDVQNIQTLLRQVQLKPRLQELFPIESAWFERLRPLKDIESRSTRCLKQLLIDSKKGQFPEVGLVKINGGGEDCFVLCCPLNGPYKSLLKSLIVGLEEIGFQGHIYYRVGGVSNPTGKEAKWAGVPYAFKIFTMMEAYNLGFSNLIWLDSSLFPFKNPQSLFDRVREEGSLMLHRSHPKGYILPATKALIETLTTVNVENAEHVRMWVFGLNMGQTWVHEFIEEYTQLVIVGTPFISCYPEEFVISALAKKFEKHIPSLRDSELTASRGYNKILKGQDKDPRSCWKAKEEGITFLIRDHT